MWNEIEARAHHCGEYIVATQCTVRTCADALGTSKSTVHKDVTERLPAIDPLLAERVKAVLEINLSERHIRGGASTKKKYQEQKSASSSPREDVG